MKKNEIVRVNKLRSRIYNPDVDIDYVIKELMRMLPKEEEGEVYVENVLSRAFYEKGEYRKSIDYYQKTLEKKSENLPSYLGLFKNYVHLNKFEKAYAYLELYKEHKRKENKAFDVTLLEIVLQNLLSSTFQYIPITNYYFEIDLAKDPIFPLYNKFVCEYNRHNYQECLVISKNLEKENRRLKLDFSILKSLVEEVLKKYKAQSLEDAYQRLEETYHEKDYQGMINSLETICKSPLQNRAFVFHSFYVLANHHYGEQVNSMLSSISLVFKEEEKYRQIIQNGIKNQESYSKLTEEQQKLYHYAIHYGKMNYQLRNLDSAYEIFRFAYEETKQPIFLHYMGKMLYKMRNFVEAEKYLQEYVKVGDTKLNKTYLYLSGIAFKNHNKKKSAQYADIGNMIQKLYGDEYQIRVDYFKEDEDILKLKIQRKEMHELTFRK